MTDDLSAGAALTEPQCHEQLRLLPWTTPEGKPCYLSTDTSGGPLARLADDVEEAQVRAGADALADASTVLAHPHADSSDVRLALARTADALGNVLRVAQSRGARLS